MSWSKWFSESFYQFVDQDITTARTTHSQDRDYILSSLLVILSWEIAWPYEENRKRECQAKTTVELSFRWRRFHVKESSPLEAIRELG